MAEPVLNAQAQVDKGENARLASFVGAIAIADLVKTCLGPRSLDKILQPMGREGDVTVTNDGATILRAIHVDNAAAKVLVDISRVQDDTIGDGTTSVAVLCGELLRQGEQLITARIHPQTIIEGWRLAVLEARGALEALATDNSADEAAFREDLLNIARTTLSSKLVTHEKDHFAELCVDAVLRLRGSDNLEHIQIIKKPGGALRDSFLADGFILNKKAGVGQPKRVENARILIGNTAMDTDKIKIYGSKVRVDSLTQVAAIEEAERDKMRRKCEKIIAHNCNCFVNRQLIYNFPEAIFAEAGVMAVEHADFDGVERLAAVTGGEIVSTFDDPESVVLGECDLIEEMIIGEDRLLRFSGCKSGEACSIVLRGASTHVLDEAERSIHDALCVLTQTVKETRTIPGGGCAEMAMAEAVDRLTPSIPGKRALALQAFSSALRQLPTIIADNGGYDSADLVSTLRAEHHAGNATFGLDMVNGRVADMTTLGVREAYLSKLQVVVSASEAAEQILRVDDIINDQAGCKIAISGIKNPQRANLRTAAVSLGADYSPDWGRTCTHLICAHQGTPKYNKALRDGHGFIVSPDWVSQCVATNTRQPEAAYPPPPPGGRPAPAPAAPMAPMAPMGGGTAPKTAVGLAPPTFAVPAAAPAPAPVPMAVDAGAGSKDDDEDDDDGATPGGPVAKRAKTVDAPGAVTFAPTPKFVASYARVPKPGTAPPLYSRRAPAAAAAPAPDAGAAGAAAPAPAAASAASADPLSFGTFVPPAAGEARTEAELDKLTMSHVADHAFDVMEAGEKLGLDSDDCTDDFREWGAMDGELWSGARSTKLPRASFRLYVTFGKYPKDSARHFDVVDFSAPAASLFDLYAFTQRYLTAHAEHILDGHFLVGFSELADGSMVTYMEA